MNESKLEYITSRSRELVDNGIEVSKAKEMAKREYEEMLKNEYDNWLYND